MRLQQKAIIIHDKLFIIANLFGEENFTVSKSLRQKIFSKMYRNYFELNVDGFSCISIPLWRI
jgi:hypothetical protein